MKVVFLDFDGVLCHWSFHSGRGLLSPDPEKVALINQIVRRTEAFVVVSSTWRLGRTVVELQKLLDDAGFVGVVFDVTPSIVGPIEGSKLVYGVERGFEVMKWLQAHAWATRYVVIDDDSDRGPIPENRWILVEDGMNHGIQQRHVDAAVGVLGGFA